MVRCVSRTLYMYPIFRRMVRTREDTMYTFSAGLLMYIVVNRRLKFFCVVSWYCIVCLGGGTLNNDFKSYEWMNCISPPKRKQLIHYFTLPFIFHYFDLWTGMTKPRDAPPTPPGSITSGGRGVREGCVSVSGHLTSLKPELLLYRNGYCILQLLVCPCHAIRALYIAYHSVPKYKEHFN